MNRAKLFKLSLAAALCAGSSPSPPAPKPSGSAPVRGSFVRISTTRSSAATARCTRTAATPTLPAPRAACPTAPSDGAVRAPGPPARAHLAVRQPTFTGVNEGGSLAGKDSTAACSTRSRLSS